MGRCLKSTAGQAGVGEARRRLQLQAPGICYVDELQRQRRLAAAAGPGRRSGPRSRLSQSLPGPTQRSFVDQRSCQAKPRTGESVVRSKRRSKRWPRCVNGVACAFASTSSLTGWRLTGPAPIRPGICSSADIKAMSSIRASTVPSHTPSPYGPTPTGSHHGGLRTLCDWPMPEQRPSACWASVFCQPGPCMRLLQRPVARPLVPCGRGRPASPGRGTRELAGADLDGVFASTAWWDGNAAWYVEELDSLARIAPVIGVVAEARSLPADAAARRRALRLAVATTDGLFLPEGFAADIEGEIRQAAADLNRRRRRRSRPPPDRIVGGSDGAGASRRGRSAAGPAWTCRPDKQRYRQGAGHTGKPRSARPGGRCHAG